MEKKKTFFGAVRALLCALIALAGPVLYFYLVNKGVGDAMMYSAGSPVFVIVLSLLGAFGVFIILKKPLFEEFFEVEDFEEYEEENEAEAVVQEISETESTRDLYPELFRDAPECEEREEETKISSAYYDALIDAINSQKAEYVPESEGEPKEATEDILEIKESETAVPDILADIPETLPEGYVPYSDEEMENENEEEEKETEEKPKGSLPLKIAKRVAAVVVIAFLSVAFGVISASAYTVYSGDGFSVHTLFSEKSYGWQDCEKYEVAPSFFGDRINVILYMKDGAKIELLPSDAVFGEAFYKKYDSMYEYALHAGNEMTALGAEKSVKERNTIENEFFGREDIGEYVKELID